jgi:hypothetical protein
MQRRGDTPIRSAPHVDRSIELAGERVGAFARRSAGRQRWCSPRGSAGSASRALWRRRITQLDVRCGWYPSISSSPLDASASRACSRVSARVASVVECCPVDSAHLTDRRSVPMRGAAMSFERRQEIKGKSRQTLPPLSVERLTPRRRRHVGAGAATTGDVQGELCSREVIGDSSRARMFTSRVPGAPVPVMSCPRSRGSVRVDRLGRGC